MAPIKQSRVYHLKNLTGVLRQRSGQAVLNALKTIRRNHRYPLVIHLNAEEPRPPNSWLRQFNLVVDEKDLSTARSTFLSFVKNHQNSALWYDEGEGMCELVFDTLGGSQQFTEPFLEARKAAEQVVGKKNSLVLEEDAEPQLRILRIRMISWREIHATLTWGEHRCIWVRGDDKESGNGCHSLCLGDQSTESLVCLARKIREGRPWLARRSKPTRK